MLCYERWGVTRIQGRCFAFDIYYWDSIHLGIRSSDSQEANRNDKKKLLKEKLQAWKEKEDKYSERSRSLIISQHCTEHTREKKQERKSLLRLKYTELNPVLHFSKYRTLFPTYQKKKEKNNSKYKVIVENTSLLLFQADPALFCCLFWCII